MIIDQQLFDSLFEEAKSSPRLRQNFDMRTSANDSSQRMLNALLPGTDVPIHKHTNSTENVLCLCGRLDEILYNEDGTQEVERYHISQTKGCYGCVIPVGVWHTVEVFEPTVIYEAKDGKYGEDGSINLQK